MNIVQYTDLPIVLAILRTCQLSSSNPTIPFFFPQKVIMSFFPELIRIFKYLLSTPLSPPFSSIYYSENYIATYVFYFWHSWNFNSNFRIDRSAAFTNNLVWFWFSELVLHFLVDWVSLQEADGLEPVDEEEDAPSDEAIDRMEKNLEDATGAQKNLFLVIFQVSICLQSFESKSPSS